MVPEEAITTTILSTLILDQEWKAVRKRLATKKGMKEARKTAVACDTPRSGFSDLPIHLAVSI